MKHKVLIFPGYPGCFALMLMALIFWPSTWAKAQATLPDYLVCDVPITESKGDGVTACDLYRFSEAEADFVLGTAPLVDIADLEAFLNASPGTVVLTGKKIFVKGNFEVYHSWTLINCDVRVSSQKFLNITEPAVFSAENTRFFCCNSRWQGIICNGAISLTNNCLIEDAVAALRFSNYSPKVTIRNTTFNRNAVGISAVGSPFGNTPPTLVLNLSDFVSNRFLCTSDMYLTGVGQDKISSAGISLFKVILTLGTLKEPDVATFDGLRVGIECSRSTVRLNGGPKFLNMLRGTETDPALLGGWGIRSSNRSDVRLGTNNPCDFKDNAAGGILSEYSSLTANNSLFENGTEGIVSVGNTGSQRVWISGNTFNLRSKSINAIIADRSAAETGVSRVIIRNNKIFRYEQVLPSTNVKTVRAIKLTCRTPGTTDPVVVEKNTYTDFSPLNKLTAESNDPDVGIEVSSGNPALSGLGNNIHLNDNTVLFQNPVVNAFKVGIQVANLSGSTGIEMNNNLVERTNSGTAATKFRGIRIRNTQSASICSNTVENLNEGMIFEGDNSSASFRTNHFGRCLTRGLFITGGGLGAQVRRGNTWENQLGLAAEASLAGLISLTPYITESSDPSVRPANTFPPNTTNWFDFMVGPTDHACAAGGAGSAGALTEMDNALLVGSLDSMGINSVRQWEQGMRLMGRMLRDPQIQAGSPAADQYFRDNYSLSMGRFARLFLMWERADSATAHLPVQLGSLEAQTDSLSLLVDTADSLLTSGVLTPAQALSWAQNRQAWAEQCGALYAQSCDLDSQIVQQRKLKYQAALTFNNSIAVSAVYESNLKSLNAALLRLAIDGAYSVADTAALENIAAQDPETGGETVLSARYAVPGGCESSGQRPLSSQKVAGAKLSAPIGLQLYPVPATDLLTVHLSAPALEGTWQVIDLNGRVLKNGQKPLSDPTFVVPLADLASGLYFIHFQTQNGGMAARRFSVVR